MKYNPALIRPGWQEGFVTKLRAGDVLDFSGIDITVTWMDRPRTATKELVKLQAEATVAVPSDNGYGYVYQPDIRPLKAPARLLDLQLPPYATVKFRRPIDPPEIALGRELFEQIFGYDNGGWDRANYEQRRAATRAAETAIKALRKAGPK